MKNQKKIDVAKQFISLHKNSDVEDWLPIGTSDDNKWLEIYSNLTGGIYGEDRGLNHEFDDDGELSKEATEYEIEISANDSLSGNAIIFEWEII